MAKVSLRIYNREIEGMIEHGQRLDEALAHCLHILKTFSKHIETYRLLGKTYLEGKRYKEAVDIFKRVLVAVPDDFVSHVGMSIISDDQGKLDDAIWYMERAFEVQPSNAAIQGELRRLFGRRDGAEPPKIRLTRGALAHMYMQGELYLQAISEIRAVLGNDSGRTDMQVLLARAYFRNQQKAEATDICNQLIKRFPYCFDANRIMVELLRDAQGAGPAQQFRQRVIDLDPYSAFTKDSIFNLEEVADAAVSLERLEYRGQAADLDASWGSTLGIGLPTDSTALQPAQAQPDWLKTASPSAGLTASPGPFAMDEDTRQSSPPQPMKEVPDFLRTSASTAASSDSGISASRDEGDSASSAVQADLPDWVKAMAPSDENRSASNSPAVDDTPAWLKDLGADDVAESTPPAKAPPQPAWLGKADAKPAGSAAPGIADPPDWLKMPAESQSAPLSSAQNPKSTADLAGQTETPGPDPAAYLGNLGTSAREQDDAMAWLEGLASKHGAKPEELVTDPRARSDVAPEWVDKAKEIGEPPLRLAPEEDNTGMWLKNLDAREVDEVVPKTESQPSSQDSLSDWRSGLSGGDDFSGLAEEKSSEAAPDWLSGSGAAPAQADSGKNVPAWPGGEADLDLPGASKELPEFSTEAGPAVDLPDWLAGLDKEEQPSPSPETFSDDLPVWLQGDVKPETAEPTHPTDWQPSESKPMSEESAVDGMKTVVEELDTPKKPPVRAEKKAAVAPVVQRPASGMPKASDTSLGTAQSELGIGNIAASLEIYSKLIRKGKFQNEIISDLREALYRYPVEVPIWQALGDAYMRANRLQEALDAYTKAEELLR